jgi:hypothetical protein
LPGHGVTRKNRLAGSPLVIACRKSERASGIAALDGPRCLWLQTRASLRISTRKIRDKRNRACCGFQPFDISPRSAANLVGFAEHHCRRDGRAGPWFSFRKFDIRREVGFVRSVAHECLIVTVLARCLCKRIGSMADPRFIQECFAFCQSSSARAPALGDARRFWLTCTAHLVPAPAVLANLRFCRARSTGTYSVA